MKYVVICISLFFSFLSSAQSKNNADTVIDTLTQKKLAKVTSLNEVIIKGKKPVVGFKIDRQVYVASQFNTAISGTGVDIVRNLPSVSVNGQGEIALRGSTSFLVLLNGKPTQGDPSFVLSQLAAASIESIELITSPSAVYDADGKAGIINIITKTGTQDGWMIQTNAMFGSKPIHNFDNKRNTDPQRYNFDVSTSYRKNKWDISGGLNFLRNDISGFREGDVYTINNNLKTSFPSMGERSFQRYNYGARVAVNYQLDKSNAISAGLYVGKKFQSRVADLIYSNTKENLIDGTSQNYTYFNQNTQEKEGVFTLANLDFSHEFINKSKINFSALFERAALSGNTYNLNIPFRGSKDTLQYTYNPNTNPLNAFRIKTDYSNKIGSGNFQMGYQYRYDTQNGVFTYLTKIIGTPFYSTDTDFSSQVKALNKIHATYVQYSGSSDKLNYSTGLRLEQSQRNLSFSNNNDQKSISLINFFPTAQLRYKAWDKETIKIGYSRRIRRTNNYELNPFPEREHSETLEQGDPALLPELIGNFEVGLEKILRKGNFFATAYYQNIENPIQRVNRVFNDTILIRAFTNAGKAKQIGLETNLSWQVTQFWQTVIGGNVYKYDIKGAIFDGVIAIKNDSWVYSINSSQSFALPKNWSLQLSVNYLSARATAQGEDGFFLTPHFTVKKTSSDAKWSFQFQWLNMDAGMKIANRQRITTQGSNFYSTTNYIYEPDQLQFSISYNLTKKNRKIALPSSEIGEKEF